MSILDSSLKPYLRDLPEQLPGEQIVPEECPIIDANRVFVAPPLYVPKNLQSDLFRMWFI
jgi:hypothetical protein